MLTLRKLQEEIGAAVLIVGHDMGLMAQFASHVGVMYAGKLVEVGQVLDIFDDPCPSIYASVDRQLAVN